MFFQQDSGLRTQLLDNLGVVGLNITAERVRGRETVQSVAPSGKTVSQRGIHLGVVGLSYHGSCRSTE